MSKDNQVVLVSTTTKGFLYNVYHKEDTERKKILYTGEISVNPSNCYCECAGWALKQKCYHQDLAKKIMEIPIDFR